jgi:cytosolic iron-sulfur protein assembly protein CIAO1
MLNLKSTLLGHDDKVWCVAWHPQGKLLASCSSDRNIKLWSKQSSDNWKCVQTLTNSHTRTIRWISWSPCGNMLGILFEYSNYDCNP